jgi:hypothetical protein
MKRVVVKERGGIESVTIYYKGDELVLSVLSSALKANKRLRGKKLMLLFDDNLICMVLSW